MAVSDFLLVLSGPDVKGESQDSDFMDAIDIAGWSYNVVSPSDPKSGLAKGRVQVSDLTLFKKLDKASPIFVKSVCLNALYDKAVLYCRKAGGGQVGYFEVEMTDVRVRSTGVAAGGDVGIIPMETIHLSFKKILWKYREQKDKGFTGSEVIHEHDMSTLD